MGRGTRNCGASRRRSAVIDALIGLLREHADAPHGVGLWYQTGAAPVIDRLLALRAELDAIRYLGRDPPPRDRGAG